MIKTVTFTGSSLIDIKINEFIETKIENSYKFKLIDIKYSICSCGKKEDDVIRSALLIYEEETMEERDAYRETLALKRLNNTVTNSIMKE